MSKQIKELIGTMQSRIANQRAEIERLREKVRLLELRNECNAKVGAELIEALEENKRLMREKTALECVVSTARNQARAKTIREMGATIIEEIEAALKSNYEAKAKYADRDNEAIQHLVYLAEGKIAALRGLSDFVEETIDKMLGAEK